MPGDDNANGDFLLQLRALPSSIPAVIRLRHVLKALLRHYRFRCVNARQLPAGQADEAEGRPVDVDGAAP